MRIRVNSQVEDAVKVPYSQNYYLASAIYATLASRPDYAAFLHDHGYLHEPSGRLLKLFVFSPLLCACRRPQYEGILLGPGTIEWKISSPMPEFLATLAEGLLSTGEVEIGGQELPISSVEAEAEPAYTRKMRFTCLSPIVVSRPGEPGEYAHFCTHDDFPEFSQRVRANLIRKHELVHGCLPEDDAFEMEFDPDYIRRKNGRVTKLINVRGTDIRGVLAPFSAQGSTDLIRIGYECGFGERGSMGFGCAQVEKEVT